MLAGRSESDRIGLAAQVVESDAILARIAERRGQLDDAVRLMESVIDRLDDQVIENALRPGRDAAQRAGSCWRRPGVPARDEALAAGLDFVDDFSGKIDDTELRDGFLRDVAAHATLVRARTEATPPPD